MNKSKDPHLKLEEGDKDGYAMFNVLVAKSGEVKVVSAWIINFLSHLVLPHHCFCVL